MFQKILKIIPPFYIRHQSQHMRQLFDYKMEQNQHPIPNLIQPISQMPIENSGEQSQSSKDISQSHQSCLSKNQHLIQVLNAYEIEDEEHEEILIYIGQRQFQKAAKFVKKSLRVNFLESIHKIIEKCEEQKLEKSEMEGYLDIFKQFKISEEDYEEALQLVNNNLVDQVILFTKKRYRQKLKEKLQAKIKQRSQQKKDQTPEDRLLTIFRKYEVEEEDAQDMLQLIKQGKREQASRVIQKKRRAQFMKQVEGIEFCGQKPSEAILLKYQNFTQKIQFQGIDGLLEHLREKLRIQNLDEHCLVLNGKKVTKIEEALMKGTRMSVLQITNKVKKFYFYYEKMQEVWLEKNCSSKEIQQSIIQSLQDTENTQLRFRYKMDKKMIDQIQNLEKEEILHGPLKEIIVDAYVQVVVFFSSEKKIYRLLSSDTIHKLKKQIQADFLPFEAQSLFYENPQKMMIKDEDLNKCISQIIGTTSVWNLNLIDTHTVEFYGFHENRTQTYDNFAEFLIENEEQIADIIKNSDFHDQKLQKLFFTCFIKSLYSSIKKRFPIQTIIDKFKQITVNVKSENIWMPFEEDKPITMNESFVFMYILYNSDEKLRIILMKLVGKLLPLPLYFRNFDNILKVSDQIHPNKEICWLLQEGITVGSIGFHSQSAVNEQKGKSCLLNSIFYTNFTHKEIKHQILKKIPFISIRVYEQLFPLNIIDIPQDCQEQIKDNLLSFCNLVIIHSWIPKQQTMKYKKQLQQQYGFKAVVLFRDSKTLSQVILKSLKQNQLTKNEMIQLPNISKSQKFKSYVDLLREQINMYLKEIKVDIGKILNFEAFPILNSLNQEIKTVMESEPKEIMKFLQISDFHKSDEPEKLQQNHIELIKEGLHPSILKLFNIISTSGDQIDTNLGFLRDKLRQFQSSTITKYMKIYKLKEKLLSLDGKTETNTVINGIHQELLSLPDIYSEQNFILNKEPEEINRIFDGLTSVFENIIRPKIFSVEIFWREIYSYLEISKEVVTPNQYDQLFSTAALLKSKEIMNNQAFEIINGDSLKMYKEVMVEVFKPIPDRCLVVTILGPQSSGKSTLLNFLFGCDFATSEGRCTRGVYGTFFRVRDQKSPNFQGIFVIDTEGLFALTNENDEKQQNRDDFDSKLVLFCLAVSDIVIINVRGNFDANTQKILRICNEKLEALNKTQENKPEIVVVLNQNSTSKTQESENQFKKIRKTFNFRIAKSLSIAYTIQNYNKEDISVFADNQILTKKTPLPHFKKETYGLLIDIMKVLRQKKGAEAILQKIDKFESIWNTVLAFPNLSRLKSKEYFELQTKIRQWRKQKQDGIEQKCEALFGSINNQEIDEKKGTFLVEDLNQSYLEEYKKQFTSEKVEKEFIILLEKEEKQILLHNEKNHNKLQYRIKEIRMKKQMNQEKFQGDFIIKEKENEILKNQNLGIKKYTDQEKEQIFDTCFEKALQKIQKSIRIEDKCKTEEERIFEDYEHLIKTNSSDLKKLGLPRQKLFKSSLSSSTFQEIHQHIRKKLNELLTVEKFMRHVNRPHTNMLKASQSDAKLKYFDARQYFEKKQKRTFFYLTKQSLSSAFMPEQFIYEFMKVKNQFNQRIGQRYQLNEVYYEINDHLSYLGIEIEDFQNFYNVYQLYKGSNLQKLIRFFDFEKISLSVVRSQLKWFHQTQFNSLLYQYNHTYYNRLINANHFDKLFMKQKFKNQWSHRIVFEDKLSPLIEKAINWGTIKERVESKGQQIQKQRAQMQRQHENFLRDQINEDLKLINMRLPQKTRILYQLIQALKMKYDKKNLFKDIFKQVEIIDEGNQNLEVKDVQQLTKRWSEMRYLNPRLLSESLKPAKNKYIPDEAIIIGKVIQTELIPINDAFKEYNEANLKTVQKVFKSKNFKQFIINEMKEKGSINKFIEELRQITQETFEKWSCFSAKAITYIFTRLNEEITTLNDDLNQISHQLTPQFMGIIHLAAILLMQKYENQLVHQKQSQIYTKKLQSRAQELRRFMMRTSQDSNDKIEEEANCFYEELIKLVETEANEKLEEIQQQLRKSFKSLYNHKKMLEQIDNEILGSKLSDDQLLEYIENPHIYLGEKYDKIYETISQQFIKEIQILGIQSSNNFELIQALELMRTNFLQKDHLTENMADNGNIFEIRGVASHHGYDEESRITLFSLFIDLLIDDEPQKERKCLDITLKPKITFSRGYKINQRTKTMLTQLLDARQLKISNLLKFVEKLLNKDRIDKFYSAVKQKFNLSDQIKKDFINALRVIICTDKCPCCGRICGVEESHIIHKCIFGHQMRAMAGNYVLIQQSKKQAYVLRCDEIEQTEVMEFNGNKLTWTAFKDYWSKKLVGGWDYDDTQNKLNESQAKKFEKIWGKVGPIYCNKRGLLYTPYTGQINKKKEMIKDAHFIFALDGSWSMGGQRWNQLMEALKMAFHKIQQYQNQGGKAYVTIILFNNKYQIIYERVKIYQVSFQKIIYKGGRTKFDPVFKGAAWVAAKTINSQTIIFIFMTDGQSAYPFFGMESLLRSKNKNPKNLIYSGIQFVTDSTMMKNIAHSLKGKNIIAKNFEELLEAYERAVEVIAYKENTEESFM